MRLDKYLKTARILKRREAAKALALQERVLVNDRVAKPSYEVKIGDQITCQFGNRVITIEVLEIKKQANKQDAALLYRLISDERNESLT